MADNNTPITFDYNNAKNAQVRAICGLLDAQLEAGLPAAKAEEISREHGRVRSGLNTENNAWLKFAVKKDGSKLCDIKAKELATDAADFLMHLQAWFDGCKALVKAEGCMTDGWQETDKLPIRKEITDWLKE